MERDWLWACKFPSDSSVALGVVSLISLIISTFWVSTQFFIPTTTGLFLPQLYSLAMRIFVAIAGLTTALAATMLLWPTMTEAFHLSRTIHHNLNYICPTAKTGLLGGGAFMSLDSCLFWLICIMLASNMRQDYFEKLQNYGKGGPNQNVDDLALRF